MNVVAYGSLMYRPSLEATLRRPAELTLIADREAARSWRRVMRGYHAFVWLARACRELPVLRSYPDVCRQGAADLGDSARPLYR